MSLTRRQFRRAGVVRAQFVNVQQSNQKAALSQSSGFVLLVHLSIRAMRSLYGTAVVLASATLAFLRPTGIYGPLSKARLALSLDTDPFPASAYHIAPGAQLWDPDTDNTVDKARWVNPFPMPLCSGIHLEEASIDDLQAWMSKGRLTARMLVQCYTSRIRQLNKWTRAVLELNPDALRIADKLDIERYTGKLRGPLHGIPYLIKDNIATRDSMETTAGSYALQGSSVPRDAHLVYLLRQQVGHRTSYYISLLTNRKGGNLAGKDESGRMGVYASEFPLSGV